MNCKQGDLAVIVRALNPENLGRICRVIGAGIGKGDGWWLVELPHAIRWLEGPVSAIGNAHDSVLRPIRDNGGDDETLIWAGLPNTEGVTQ